MKKSSKSPSEKTLKADVSKLTAETATLKSDISALKHSAGKHPSAKTARTLRSDTATLKKDTTALKADTAALKKKEADSNSKHKTKSKLSPGWDVACCAAEALAASLRLAGHPVGYDDALAMYWRTAGDPDEGATILDTLLAAREFGVAGFRPYFEEVMPSDPPISGHCVNRAAGLITGVTLPGGPHAFTLDPSGGLWSWGELYDPAEFAAGVIEEAWWIRWE